MYDKNYYSSKSLYANHFLDKNLTFRVIQNGYILPRNSFNEGGIFDSEGSYINHTSFREGGGFTKERSELEDNSSIKLADIADLQHIDIPAAKHHHSTVVYIGIMLKTWGHFLTDDMRLLWFLRSKEYRDNFADCPIAYLPAHGFSIKGNWLRMLEILGINIPLMTPITELTRYDKIIVPDECFFMSLEDGTRYFTREYVEIIDTVRDFALANTKPAHDKKIYFSHSTYKGTGWQCGEERLEKYFASKGYEIIPEPGDLGLDDELNALVHCDSFASTIGSCAHNMIFCRDNTEVILIPRANYFTGYQLAIDQVHPQNIHYIDSSFSIFAGKSPWGGPFLYFISSNLRKYFHDQDAESIIYPSDFWKYLRSAFGLKFSRAFGHTIPADNPNVYRYYSTVAAEYFGKLFHVSWPYRFRMWLKKLLRRGELTQ